MIILGTPVRKYLRPPGSPKIAGNPRVTQDFGPTTLPAEPKVIWPGGDGIAKGTYTDFHQGLDIGDGRCGADVLAAANGLVAYSATDGSGSKTIVIDHGSGYRTRYAHLATRSVAKGARVTRGQKIGTIGDTGMAIGCHLHFALEDASFATVVAIRGTSRSYLKLIDPWPRLEQNVTVRPAQGVDAIRIRTEPTLDPATKYAETKAGQIVRADGVVLASAATWLKYRGETTGAEYGLPDGSKSRTWWQLELDGKVLVIAAGYAERSVP